MAYGPAGLKDDHDYSLFSTPNYLRGYAHKIERDLIKIGRMYNAKRVRVFALTGTERCERCTNVLTGEVLDSHCPECNGTGRKKSWSFVGRFWAYVDFGPEMRIALETGLTHNPGNDKENFVIIGAPILHDQDFFVVEETRQVFKVFDIEPKHIAMGGTIIAQSVQASSIEDGSPEYRVVDW